jgi:hypothetical protein
MIISTLVNNIRSEDHVFLSIFSRELLIDEARHIFRMLSRAQNESQTIFIEIHADCCPRGLVSSTTAETLPPNN